MNFRYSDISPEISQDFQLKLHRLCRLWQRYEHEVVSCADLTVTECQALQWLAANPEGDLEDLAIALDVTRGRLTRVLDSLEEKSLIKRIPRKTDRRALQIQVTAAARRRADQAHSARMNEIGKILSGIPNSQHQQLLNMIETLIQRIEA